MSATLKFGTRVPRQTGDISQALPIALVEIPVAGPDETVAVVDTAGSSHAKGALLDYGTALPIAVTRSSAGTGTDPSTSVGLALSLPSGIQSSLISPIKVTRVLEDSAGCWHPRIQRGIVYRLWKMNAQETSDSWLSQAGYTNGQYLLLAHTTELDWRARSSAARWAGLGSSGGGAPWSVQTQTAGTLTARQVLLSADPTAQIRALGGLVSETGLELLTEAPRYQGSTLLPAGDGGVLSKLTCSLYQAQPGTPGTGRTRGLNPVASAAITVGTFTYSALLTTLNASVPAGQSCVRFSGAFRVATEGYYKFTFAHGGRLRAFHWGLPVVDRWYGSELQPTSDTDVYTAYLHVGWHDFIAEWAPDNNSDTFGITVSTPVDWCSVPTSRSQVAQISTDSGVISLRQDYVSGLGDNVAGLKASYAATSKEVPLRGYLNSAGGWVSLDLNPAPGHTYSRDDKSASPPSSASADWADTASCWIFAVPSAACALTDASGTVLAGGTRNWKTCLSYGVRTTLRFGTVKDSDVVSAGYSQNFGASGAFGNAVLGQSLYSSTGTDQSVNTFDPRGGYNSGLVLAHLTCIGLPGPEDVIVHDLRSRGGGLSHETDPAAIPPGGPRERAATYWDLSAWDGDDAGISGVAVVEIPQSYLDGSDGGPAFTAAEIENVVNSSIAAGVHAHIIYTP